MEICLKQIADSTYYYRRNMQTNNSHKGSQYKQIVSEIYRDAGNGSGPLSSNISGYFKYNPTCKEPKAASAKPVDKVNDWGSPKPKDRNAILNVEKRR